VLPQQAHGGEFVNFIVRPRTFDIEIAIESVRNNKASDKDNICIKLYKKGEQILINMLHSINKMIQIEEKLPKEWKTNITAPTYKNKGDKLQSEL
jgi:hypothetical protein